MELRRLAELPGEDLARRRPEISAWSVAEQLEHLALSDLSILQGLGRLLTDPASGQPVRLTWTGRLVLALGFIPRGRGRSPRSLRPQASEAEALRSMLREASERLAGLRDRLAALAACRTGFRHPYFGILDPRRWLRFVEVHQHHHLKIIRDIRKHG